MHPLELYLSDVHDIRQSGAAQEEPSYYPPLRVLLNEAGKTLKPTVLCIINLKNQGEGLPDGGFFTPDQLRQVPEDKVFQVLPSRGALEVKGTGTEISDIVKSDQIENYLKRYRQVLVTNLRCFAIVERGPNGEAVQLESYSLAQDEAAFWASAAHPRRTANEHGERFAEYLKRVMTHSVQLTEPKDVAWILASYARDAKARVDAAAALPALETVRRALEEALGIKFEGEKGERFFRSTLVQTVFYGVFSAWVLWDKTYSRTDETSRFDWRSAQWLLHVPMIRSLYHQIAAPDKLKPLGLVEVLDWTADALNRVDRAEFFSRFEESDAVQYFYEPFLQEFDPELRKELGVWYTPPEIVKYMVARVDTVLREELGIEDGLADPQVYVLDPCCGTGTYLLEVLKCIRSTLKAKGHGALIGQDVKRAALERVFGFEILPAPFVIGHLQLGLLLQRLGAPLSDEASERAGIYLTNALTGWEPPTEEVKKQLAQLALSYPELGEEREQADRVKTERPILVVLGNPPYNAFAGVSPKEEKGLVEPYKEGLIAKWKIKKFNLDDLYVRFFRLAERRIAEMSGRGVVCYISNHSWVSDPSFVVLRAHLMNSFEQLWIDNMHGDRRTSEYAPDGTTSETVFATPGFSPGIKQGVVISLWVKRGGKYCGKTRVLFRDSLSDGRASERRAHLLSSLSSPDFKQDYDSATPTPANRFSFRPCNITGQYLSWPRLTELCSQSPSNGLMEKRGGALIAIDKCLLRQRMRLYYDKTVQWESLASLGTGLTKDAARFDARKALLRLRDIERYKEQNVRCYLVRPFDLQWCYHTLVRPLWNEPRPTLAAQCWPGNAFLMSRVAASKNPEGPPFYFTKHVSDDHALSPDASCFPLRLSIHTMFGESDPVTTQANLSSQARDYFAELGFSDPDSADSVALIWLHALAIGYSPEYLAENADGIRQDWPRIPLPDSKEALLGSAELGRTVAELLDVENPVPTVTSGAIREELRVIGTISREEGGTLNPDAGELSVTAGWGHAGQGGVTMPGKGKIVQRPYTTTEEEALRRGAEAFGMTFDQAVKLLGQMTCDIYLNDIAYWRNIPARVWGYTIGGYQVIKKWLSYREHDLLGRSLKIEEAHYVEEMARRIASIVLLEPKLDANYKIAAASTYKWPGHIDNAPSSGI